MPCRPQFPANAMSVDVEDWFQVQAFAGMIDRADWDRLPRRVEANTERVLALFASHGVRATFFILGWIAERHPGLVRRIAEAGHEIASHGWEHVQVNRQTPDAFRQDVRRTRLLLEDIGGQPVAGYRAASFSIGRDTLWAHRVLREEGYLYSSSIYPIRHDLYGMVEAPRFPFMPLGAEGVVELPVTAASVAGVRLPCGGGGYFRLLPYALSRWAIRRVNRTDHRSCVFYFHPWEIDPGQPRVESAPARSRLRHYTNLAAMAGRLGSVLSDFTWDRMDRVFAADIQTG